jgi:hypothetical protein
VAKFRFVLDSTLSAGRGLYVSVNFDMVTSDSTIDVSRPSEQKSAEDRVRQTAIDVSFEMDERFRCVKQPTLWGVV